MSIVMLKSSKSALLMTGSFDIVGNALCKLAQSVHDNPFIQVLHQQLEVDDSAGINDSAEIDDYEDENLKALKNSFMALSRDLKMFGPIINCVRQLRDAIAIPNGISADSQHESAAYQAEDIAEQLEQED